MNKVLALVAMSSIFASSTLHAAGRCNSACESKVERTLSQMSLTEKIGQMLLIGFRGQRITAEHQITRDIQKNKVGSVILFEYDAKLKKRARNIKSSKQLKQLTNDLKYVNSRATKAPLFIAIDEEGGLVTRLKSRYGFNTFPSPEQVGKRDDLDYTYGNASELSQQLKSMGVNMNFAPVVDVNVNPNNPVIGKLGRSFSQDEHKVALHAEQVIRAHKSKKVNTALKHFPGHGSSTKDSHKDLVDVTDSWEQRELYPYQYLIERDLVEMIMSAHVFQRDLDAKYPATLSRKIISGVLRGELGYDGVVISDDMNMEAIHRFYALDEAIRLSINAGIDILLFGNNIQYDKNIATKAQKIIKDLIKKNKISVERIEQSVRRVLRLKFS